MSDVPPSKKQCKEEAHRGQKGIGRSVFENYEAKGRVRCRLCFKRWFDLSVQHAVVNGMALEEARQKFTGVLPPIADVPSYAYASTGAIDRHVSEKHPELMEKDKHQSELRFKPLAKSTIAGFSEKEVRAGLVFCMNPTLSFRLASDPWFTQAYGDSVSRKKIPEIVLAISTDLRQKIQAAVGGSTVALALDGWTNWRHVKTFNFVIIWNSQAIFWCSVPSFFGKSSAVLTNMMRTVIEDVESTLQVEVCSVVADNENANKGLFKALKQWRPSLECVGCNAHGLQLVMCDLFKSDPLVMQAMKAVDRVLRVFERNPNMSAVLLRAQNEGRQLQLIFWGATRWSSKVHAMRRVYELNAAINFVISEEPAQKNYILKEEEVSSMLKCLPLLEVLAEATDKAEQVDATLAGMFKVMQHVDNQLAEIEKDDVLFATVQCVRHSIKKRKDGGCLSSIASEAAHVLEPKERPAALFEPSEHAESYIKDLGKELLLRKRFGDTSSWPEEKRNEMKAVIEINLKAQFNKYVRHQPPFFDGPNTTANGKTYWESKLREAEELAETALFLRTVAVSEAAVERTFSTQKFIDTPLRNKLADIMIQASMFVRFNFVNFGADEYIPTEIKLARSAFKYHYSDLPREKEEESESSEDTLETDPSRFLLFSGAQQVGQLCHV